MDAATFTQTAQRIEAEVKRVIVGQDAVVRAVLICVIAGRHALLEGVPGLGKTVLIKTLAQALHLKFARIQFTPDLMPADITGTDILEETEEGRRVFRFQPGPVFANLLLADEINRATPKTQSALLEAMQEKTVTVANRSYSLEAPFFVLATQNPIEQEGTYPLPEAQLDRFMFKINVGFPAMNELIAILDRTTGVERADVQQAADGATLIEMSDYAESVAVPTHVTEAVARLIVASHPESTDATPLVRQFVRYGASPRGAQAIIRGAKINALLEGESNVSFKDIAAVAADSLRHRLLLNFEGMAEGIRPEAVVDELLRTMKVMA
jgi:MoxR-like ATPase